MEKSCAEDKKMSETDRGKIAFYVALHYAVVEVIIAAVSQLFIAPTNEFPA